MRRMVCRLLWGGCGRIWRVGIELLGILLRPMSRNIEQVNRDIRMVHLEGMQSLPQSNFSASCFTNTYKPQIRTYGVTRSTFSLLEWPEQPEVVEAWAQLTKKHNLIFDPFKIRAQVFSVKDSAIIGGWGVVPQYAESAEDGFPWDGGLL